MAYFILREKKVPKLSFARRKENLRNHGLRYHPGNIEDFGLDSKAVAAGTTGSATAAAKSSFSAANEDRSAFEIHIYLKWMLLRK